MSFLSSRRRAFGVGFATMLLSLTPAREVAASGKPERMVQVLGHPTDPQTIVVRYGVATEGFLFSKDGGKTFRAFCTGAIAPQLKGPDRVDRISLDPIGNTAPTLFTADGRLMFGVYGGLWSDDGTGCSWAPVDEFKDKWPYALQRDPREPALAWAAVNVNKTLPAGDGGSTRETSVELMKRDASGKWSLASQVLAPQRDKGLTDGDMLVWADASKRRIYVSMVIAGVGSPAQQRVMVSDDDGQSWTSHDLPVELARMVLVAVDPKNGDRLLGVSANVGKPDQLYLSENKGQSFQPYGELQDVTGASFDAEGRLFVSDAGEPGEEVPGGLYMAPQLGQPLKRVGDGEHLDCVAHHPQSDRLFVCNRERLKLADPASFALEEVTALTKIEQFISCPGRDLHDVCEEQLNLGPAWCCVGHFPESPICDGYDVTMRSDGTRVICGASARESSGASDAGSSRPSGDASTGRGGAGSVDAGTANALKDAGARADDDDDDARPRASKSDDGCSARTGLSADSADSGRLSLLFAALTLLFRRGRRRHGKASSR